MPTVAVWSRPNGLPIAMTGSPTWRADESPSGIRSRLRLGHQRRLEPFEQTIQRVGRSHGGDRSDDAAMDEVT